MNFLLQFKTKLVHSNKLFLPLKGGFLRFAVLIFLIIQFNFQHEEVVSHFVLIIPVELRAKITDLDESG